MRTRDWRRYKEKIKVIKRLKRSNRYGTIINANNERVSNYRWIDQIGTPNHFMYKTYTTNRTDSKYKTKYGKSGKYTYWYSEGEYRAKDKREFRKMLEVDYGIKHFNISYGFGEIDTGE
jgi:hypothetical protein